ncbi:MAG TPA: DUF4238 domain-containing protein [Pirellulales bacterium]|nr:DUF4238 domain-containing protein [Pirellulales bacterium]
MGDKTTRQNQHYVPQFILRRFHNEDGRLHVYDKWTRRSFVSSARNVAAETGFYDIKVENEVVTLEPVMCEIESAALGAINALTDNASLASMSVEDKYAVAYFFGVQAMRTRSARDLVKQMQEAFRRILPEKNLQESDLPAGFFMDEEQLRMASLMNLRIADELTPHLLNKAWLLNQAPPECSFLISDNPLARHNDHTSDLRGNGGLACRGIQIHMPLSPTVTLSFLCETLIAPFREYRRTRLCPGEPLPLLDAIDFGRPLPIANDSVTHLNSLQVANATRFVFASNDDFSLVERMLDENPNLAKPDQVVVR